MERRAGLPHALIATLLAAACLCAGAPTVRAGESRDAAELLRLLEEGDFDARKSVEKRLQELGEDARAELEKAAKSPSPELRETALRLLEKLSQAVLIVELLDRGGVPLAGARVTLNQSVPNEQAEVLLEEAPGVERKTDAAGRIVQPPCAPGVYYYTLTLSDHTFAENQTLSGSGTLLLRPGENLLRIVAVPRSRFSGVIQGADGLPLHDATVSFIRAYGPLEKNVDFERVYKETLQEAIASVQTGKDGRFESQPIDAARYHVFIRHPEYALSILEGQLLEEGQARELPPRKLTQRAAPQGEIKFKLLGGTGEPVAARTVSVQLRPRLNKDELSLAVRTLKACYTSGHNQQPGAFQTHQAETDEQGTVVLREIPAGHYDVIISDEDEERTYYAENVLAERAPPDKPGLKAEKFGKITGRLQARNGSGQKGLQVFALDEGTAVTQLMLESVDFCLQMGYMLEEFASMALSGDDGEFELAGLPPGSYALMVCAESRPLLLSPGHAVALGGATQAAALILDYENISAYAVSGKVLQEDRAPAANATVYLVDNEGNSTAVNTSDDGEFNLTMHSSKPLWLGVSTSGSALHTQELTGAMQGLEIVLKKAANGLLRVNVRNGTGQPLAGTTVQLAPAEITSHWNPNRLSTGPHGDALFRNLRPGTYRVEAHHTQYGGTAKQSIDVLPGGELVCNIRFPEPARLEGRVAVSDGVPAERLARTQVLLWQNGEGDPSLTFGYGLGVVLLTPDSAGRFQSGALPPGKYIVAVQGPGVVSAAITPQQVELKPGTVTQAELRVAPACKVRVSWWDGPGDWSVSIGPPGFQIEYYLASRGAGSAAILQPLQTQSSSGASSLLLQDLPPGVYDIALRNTASSGMIANENVECTRWTKQVRITPEHARTPLEIIFSKPDAPQTLRLNVSAALMENVQTGNIALCFRGRDTDVTVNIPTSELQQRGRFRVLGRDVPNSVQVEVPGLSSGEYACSTRIEWYQREAGTMHPRSETITLPSLPPSTTLSPGAPNVLPPLRVEIPAEMQERFARENRQRMIHVIRENMYYNTQQPGVEGFQP